MFTIIGSDGTESGPVDLAALRMGVAEGRIQPQTIIWERATKQRQAASDMASLRDSFRALPLQVAPTVVRVSTVPMILCPACSRLISAQAATCPNCGHPMATVPSLEQKWTQIKKVGGLVAAAIIVLTLGAQAAFLKLVSGVDSGEVASTLQNVFLQTAPFTIAVTIIGLTVMWKWIEGFLQLIAVTGVVLFVSLVLGSYLGGLGKLPEVGGNPGMMLVSALKFYWGHYGPSLFVSSLILGIFLTWVMTKLWPMNELPINPSSAEKMGS